MPVEHHLNSAGSLEGSDRELRVVGNIAEAFHRGENPTEVYKLALEQLTPLVGASFSCVFLKGEDSELLEVVTACNWPEQHAEHLDEMRVRVGNGPTGRAVLENAPVEVADVFATEEHTDWWDAARELGFTSSIALPLTVGGSAIGAATFYFAEPPSFEEADRDLLRLVAQQLSATAEKAHLIEDLKQANRRLKDQNVELEARCTEADSARRVKTEFLANVSHELRTPLTAITGYAFLLKEGVHGSMSEEQTAAIARIEDASDRLIHLIDGLLDLTNLRLDRIQPNLELCDAVGIARQAIARTPEPSEDVELELNFPEKRVPVHTDSILVQRILESLLSNAVKFTEDGTVVISVSEEEPEPAPGQHYRRGSDVVWEVRDTGIGISEGDIDVIFEDFRQVDGSPTRRFGGTGLGLAIARGLAHRLGGEITVESRVGKGSVFRFRLASSVVQAGQ